MNKKKKEITLCGRLIRPIILGKSAIYITAGTIYKTSPVIAIHKQDTGSVFFETKGAFYHLFTCPLQPTTVNQRTDLCLCA